MVFSFSVCVLVRNRNLTADLISGSGVFLIIKKNWEEEKTVSQY